MPRELEGGHRNAVLRVRRYGVGLKDLTTSLGGRLMSGMGNIRARSRRKTRQIRDALEWLMRTFADPVRRGRA